MVVHEAVKNFGVGAEVAARIQEELFGQLKAPVRRVASAFCPVPFAVLVVPAAVPEFVQVMSVGVVVQTNWAEAGEAASITVAPPRAAAKKFALKPCRTPPRLRA